MRGVAGGAILGVPLLYTQETWLHGRSVSSLLILAGVVATFAVNVALSYFVGFRPGGPTDRRRTPWWGWDSPSYSPSLLLLLLDRVGTETSWENVLGVAALTAIPVSIGFSIGVGARA